MAHLLAVAREGFLSLVYPEPFKNTGTRENEH